MIKVGVPGVNGRMGANIAQQVLQAAELQLTAVVVRPGNPLVGSKFGDSDLVISDTFNHKDLDVVIDFTLPAGVMEHLDYCVQQKIAMVIGATGFTAQQLDFIKDAAQQIPIVQAYNMSLGVNLFYKVIAEAARVFNDPWRVEIHDVHHQHKKDTPSGTAKELAKIVANESGKDAADIAILSERRGEAIGLHSVNFITPEESVMLLHHAESRDIFANGAMYAAKWVVGKEPRLYTMQDVIERMN